MLHLWSDWAKTKTVNSNFIIVATTSVKAQELRTNLYEAQKDQAYHGRATNPAAPEIDVQTAADFLRRDIRPGEHLYIVVDTLFPDIFACDYSVYVSLKAWISRSDKVKNLVRICLLQPEPVEGWSGELVTDVQSVESGTMPPAAVEESIVPLSDMSNDRLAASLASELMAIPDLTHRFHVARVLILCEGDTFNDVYGRLPFEVLQRWDLRSIPTHERGYLCQRPSLAVRDTVFCTSAGIADVAYLIYGLTAIICIGPQDKQVFNHKFKSTLLITSNMSVGEVAFCRTLLYRHQTSGGHVPRLCHFQRSGEKLEHNRQILFSPLEATFLMVGLLKTCDLDELEGHYDWLKPGELCYYVALLINMRLVDEQLGNDTSQSPNSLKRTLKLRDNRAEKTFRLMMESDRANISFCWLEAIIGTLQQGLQIDDYEIMCDSTTALIRLIAMFRPRPAHPGIQFPFEGCADPEEAISQLSTDNFPENLHSWTTKGRPWLAISLYDMFAKARPFPPDRDDMEVLEVPKIMQIYPNLLRLISDDIRKMESVARLSGELFKWEHPVNENHISVCYEMIMRQILTAFYHQLVLLTRHGEIWYGFEVTTKLFQIVSNTPSNRLITSHIDDDPEHLSTGVWAIYFTKTLLEDKASVITDLLIVPTHLVVEWERELGIKV
ncbi:hypothetical protein F4678DRAFT_460434 [Xylaria arbuscula]|nr:hypothetical protein F4678DRAFT_460434 [Xylaria arbuscula]